MKKKTPKLSKKSNDLIESFDSSAYHWGWQSDEGTGKDAADAEADYNESKADLIDHVLKLEQTIKRLKAHRKNVAEYIETELIPRIRP